MFTLINSLRWVAVVLLLFEQLPRVHSVGEEIADENSAEHDTIGDQDDNGVPNSVKQQLQAHMEGITCSFACIKRYSTHEQRSDHQITLHFNPTVGKLFQNRIVVGAFNGAEAITGVSLTFHHADGDYVRDDAGQRIEYTSNYHDLGHVVDILHTRLSFAYALCRIRFKPDSNFDPKYLFFHYSIPPKFGGNYNPLGIAGPTLVYTDLIPRNYSVVRGCPYTATCMWYLDGDLLSNSPTNSLAIIFELRHIGNRTLLYVAYYRGRRITLASLFLSILPNQACTPLSRSPKNRWLRAGGMRSPRAYFTATILQNNQSVLIVGGTADGVTPLASVEVYNLTSGCSNVYNMLSARMKHTATYLETLDKVLVAGGLSTMGVALSQSVLLTQSGAQSSSSMGIGRYSHQAATLYDRNVLFVPGRGTNNADRQLEIFNLANKTFVQISNPWNMLFNLEGHSVTSDDNPSVTLIFGGYNGTAYPGVALFYNRTDMLQLNISIENEDEEEISIISQRAGHQVTYIPSLRAFLLTGGHNHTNALSSCYLIFVNNGSFIRVGSMSVQRTWHAAVRMENGSVLVIGGAVEVVDGMPMTPTASVERLDLNTLKFVTVGRIVVARYGHIAVSDYDNEIFLFGGIGCDSTILASIEYMMYQAG